MKKALLFSFLLALFFIPYAKAAITSIDRVDMISSYKDLDGPIWIVDWTAAGTADELYGYAKSSQIRTDNKVAEQDLIVRADTVTNYAKYSLLIEYDKPAVATVNIEKKWFWPWEKSKAQEMYDNCNGEYFYAAVIDGNPVTGYTVVCARSAELLGRVGKIYNKRILFKAKFTVEAKGKAPESGYVTNDGGKEGSEIKIGDNVWIQWLGNLRSGKEPEDPDDVKALFGPNGWKIIDKEKYYDYTEWLGPQGKLVDCLWDIVHKIETVDSCTNQFNSYAYRAAKEDTSDPFVTQGGFSIENRLSKTRGQVKIDLPDLLVFPRFRLFIDTDYLTLHIPAGKPKIVRAWSPKFSEGTTGKIYVEIKNIGDETGSFTVWAECEDPFDYADVKKIVKLDAGEDATVSMDISMSSEDRTQQTVSRYCTVYVQERTTMERVSTRVRVEADLVTHCTPGHRICSGNLIKECDPTGQKYILVKECEHGCEIVGGMPRCKEVIEKETICTDGIDNDGDALVDCEDPDCEGKKCAEGKTCINGACVKGCRWWDIPCHIRLLFEGVVGAVKTALLVIGAIVIIVLLIYIILKVSGRSIPIPKLR